MLNSPLRLSLPVPVLNVKQIWLRNEPKWLLWYTAHHFWELIYFCSAGNLNRTGALKANCWCGSIRRFMKQTVSCEQSQNQMHICCDCELTHSSNCKGTALNIHISEALQIFYLPYVRTTACMSVWCMYMNLYDIAIIKGRKIKISLDFFPLQMNISMVSNLLIHFPKSMICKATCKRDLHYVWNIPLV